MEIIKKMQTINCDGWKAFADAFHALPLPCILWQYKHSDKYYCKLKKWSSNVTSQILYNSLSFDFRLSFSSVPRSISAFRFPLYANRQDCAIRFLSAFRWNTQHRQSIDRMKQCSFYLLKFIAILWVAVILLPCLLHCIASHYIRMPFPMELCFEMNNNANNVCWTVENGKIGIDFQAIQGKFLSCKFASS